MKNVTERKGLLYFRRKIAGKDTYIRLPAADDPSFAAEYARLAAPDAPRPRPASGTLGALVATYRASAQYRQNAASTRGNQARYLDMIERDHGHRSVAGVRPAHVYLMRDKFAEMPGKANNWLSVFRLLMAHACRIDLRADNPASGIKALDLGEYEPWPADLLTAALEAATPMTRLAVVTGLCSGQRVSDCIRMQHGWHDGSIMELRNKKGRLDVAIPMHPFWIEELARLPRKSVTLLYERSGAPFHTTGAIQSRIRDLMATPAVAETIADLIARGTVEEGTTFSFHGLRKNACCYLLELGLNDSEAGSILGMSAEMVRHYGKRTRALTIARGTVDRVTRGQLFALPGATAAQTSTKNG